MRLQRLAAVAGVIALGLTALPQAASADARLGLSLAGLAPGAAPVETVGYYYSRRHRSHGTSRHGTRRPRFDHRRRFGRADGYGTAPRKYGYRRDPRFPQFHDPRRPSGTAVRRHSRPYYHRGHTRPFYRRSYRRGYRRTYRPYARTGRHRYDYRSRYIRPRPRGRRY